MAEEAGVVAVVGVAEAAVEVAVEVAAGRSSRTCRHLGPIPRAGAVTNSEAGTASTASSRRARGVSPCGCQKRQRTFGSPAATHPKNRRRFGTEANQHRPHVRASAGSGQDGQNGPGHSARDVVRHPCTLGPCRTSSSSSSSWPRSRARRVRSAWSPTGSARISRPSRSRSTRTTPILGSAPTPATCSPGRLRPRRTAASRSSSAHISTRFHRGARARRRGRRGAKRRGTIPRADIAVAAMLEGVRRIPAENRPHAGIEPFFTPKEEVGLGAKAFALPHRAWRQTRDSSSTREHRSATSFSALHTRVRSRW